MKKCIKKSVYDTVGKGFLGVLVILAVFAGLLALAGVCRAREMPAPALSCERVLLKMKCEVRHVTQRFHHRWAFYDSDKKVIATQKGRYTTWKKGTHITEEWRTLAVEGKYECAYTEQMSWTAKYYLEVRVRWKYGKLHLEPGEGMKEGEEE